MKNKVYRGWTMVLAIFLIMSSLYAIPFNVTNIFIGPIAEDLNISRTACHLIVSLRAAGTVVMYILSKHLFKRFKLKQLISFGVVGTGACMILSTFAESIPFLYITHFTMGLCIAFITELTFSVVINNWFVEKISLANGISTMGAGLGGAFFSRLAGTFMSTMGWRSIYRYITIIALLVSIPSMFYLKAYPSELGLEPYGSNKEEGPIRRGLYYDEVKSSPHFWINIIMTVLLSLGFHIVVVGLPDHLNNVGYSFNTAAKVTSFMLFILAFMKVFLGYLYDRFSISKVFFFLNLVQIIGLISVINADNKMLLPLISVCFGIGSANFNLSLQACINELYGNIDYSNINRMFMIFNSFLGSMGPVISGLAYDSFGNYTDLYKILLIASFVLMFLLQFNINKIKRLNYGRAHYDFEQ